MSTFKLDKSHLNGRQVFGCLLLGILLRVFGNFLGGIIGEFTGTFASIFIFVGLISALIWFVQKLKQLNQVKVISQKPHKSLRKKGIVLFVSILFLLLLLLIGGYFGYVFYRDHKTHIYTKGQEFYYDGYRFKLDYSITKIPFNPKDCSQLPVMDDGFYVGGSATWISLPETFPRHDCEGDNQSQQSYSENNLLLDFNATVENTTSNVRPVSTTWFKVVDAQGNVVDLSKNTSVDFPTNDLLPGEVRSGEIKGVVIKKVGGNLRISIGFPKKATQFVIGPE